MKRIVRNFLSALVLLASFSAYAVEPNKTGDLAVIVAVSKSLEYLQEWISTPPEKAVPVPRQRQLLPEETGYAAFIVTGLSANANNEFRYTISWRLIGPSGKIVIEYPNYARGSGQLHTKPTFYMANPALDLIFEETDPAGSYKLDAIVFDLVANETASHSYQLELKK